MRAAAHSSRTTWLLAAILALLLWQTIPSSADIERQIVSAEPLYRVDAVTVTRQADAEAWLVTEAREVLAEGDIWGAWYAAVVVKPTVVGGEARTVCSGSGRAPYSRDKGDWLVLEFDRYVGSAGCQQRLQAGTHALIINKSFDRPGGGTWDMPRFVVDFEVPPSLAE